MKSNLIAVSIIFLGICMVLSSWLISNELSKQNRYEFTNASNMIIDKKTGDYWINSAENGWLKYPSPKKN